MVGGSSRGLRLGSTWLAGLLLAGCSVELPEAKFFIEQHCDWQVPLGKSGKDIPVAAIVPMSFSGRSDPDGVARTQAMRLALDAVNERQGIAGRRFGLRVCDTTSTWAGDRSRLDGEFAEWLAAAGVRAIIAGGSADTMEIHSRTIDSDVLVMAFTATSMDITDLHDQGLVWRVSASDLFQGAVMARLLSERKAAKVTVLHAASSYGDSLAKALRDAAPGLDLESYRVESDPTAIDKGLAAAAARGGDWLVVAADAGVGSRILDGIGGRPGLAGAKLLLCDALHKGSVLAKLEDPDRVHGALGTLPGNPAGPVFSEFAKNYELRFDTDATQLSFTAHAYDAMFTLLLAHAYALRDDPDADVSGTALAEGLRHLSSGETIELEPANFAKARGELLAGKSIDVEGASGPLDFDPKTGEAASAVEVWEVQSDLAFKTLKWVKATRTDKVWDYEDIPPK